MTAVEQDTYIPYNAVAGDVSQILEILDLIMDLTDIDFAALRDNRRNADPKTKAAADVLARMKTIRLAVGGLYQPVEQSIAA